jgi:hypothetical protein
MKLDMPNTHNQTQEQPRQEKHHWIAKGFVLACPMVLAAIQFLPTPPRTNPHVDKRETIEANLDIPAPVAAMLQRSCMNCHSNETRWPWYTRMAPASWMTTKDVDAARKAMNLSRWSSQSGRRPDLAIGSLTAACADLQTGRMPMRNYVLLHPEARVTKLEVDQFCAWSKGEIRELAKRKQQQSRDKFTKLLQTRNDSR